MKQSTFSAVMANKLLTVLQGYTKGIRFTAILTLLFTIGVGQMWGATLTITGSASGITTTDGTQSITVNGIQFGGKFKQYSTTALWFTSGSGYIYNKTSLGTINSITINYKSGGSAAAKQYFSSGTSAITTYKSGTAQITTSTGGSSGTYSTFSGGFFNISISNKNLQATSIVIDYTPAATDTKVTISKGSVSNGSISLNKTSVTTTSAAQSVTVTCTPNTGYYTKSVSATKPATGNTPTYGGSGNSRTVTYSKGSNGSSTITATFSPQWQLRGTFNNWGTTHPLTSFSGNIATVTVDLQAMTAYTFKFVNVSGSTEQWYGNTGAIITDISDWAFSTSVGDDARLFTGPKGTYTFKFNISTKALQVIYPTVTHPAEGYAYFQKQDSWNGFKVYNYTSDTDRLSDWDGSPSVTNTTTICGKTYYYTALATQFQKVIFRDNGSNQWKEISVSGYSGKYCGDDYNATPQTWKTFNKYSITFNSNGGSGSMTALSGICPGESQTLTANSFTRAGHTFNGWNTKADGTGTNYADKATIANINSNITLYAKWKANTYTITSNLTNCSSSPAIPTSYTYTGSAANLTYTITPESGYRLPDAITVSGCTYTWDKTTSQLTLTGTINSYVTITITAIKVHTITWKVNGQQYGEKQEVVDGQTIGTLPDDPDAPTSCSDKVFMGWTESATVDSNGTGITYISDSTKPDGDKTYHAVFATKEGGSTSVVTDKLTRATTGISNGSGYGTWSGKKATSSAVYAGQSAGGNDAIQIRTTNSNSGIISTTSGGKITKVSVVWNSNTSSGRTLNVYGKNSAYSAATDLYDTSKDGDMLGTIVYGSSTELIISGDYQYIGLRSSSGAMYLTSVSITWSAGSEPTYTEYVTSCIPQHTITLNPNGGTIDDNDWIYDNGTGYYTQTVSEGTVLNFPTATKTGYTNIGWKDNLGDAVTSITVSENATYTAAYDCALATVGISGTYALTVGDVFELVATAYDSNGDVLTCPANTTYSWERYNSVDGVWEAITDDKSDGDDAKLTFNNCQIANCGTYRCHVSYGECETSSHTTAADGGFNVHCFHLKGDFEGNWGIEYAFNHTDEEGIATLTLDLISGRTHNFKIYDGISQYGNGGTISASVTDWTYGSNNNSNTILQTGADGTYVFTLDFTQLIDNSTNVLSLDVTYPPSNQSEGYTVYYDNLVHNWQNVYYRIGHNRDNGDGTWGWNQNQKMTKVPGTSHLYTTKTPQFDNFEAWHIANNVSWADKNSIYLVNPDGTEYDITHATEYKKFVVVEDLTLTPEATGSYNSTENCTYYPAAKQSGMKTWKATVIPAVGGTITVKYTHHDGTAVTDFTSGDRDLAHTCLLTITATPDAGYKLGTLTVNDVAFTSGNVHTLTEDTEIKVTWTEKSIPTFEWSADSYTAALEADNTFPTLSNPNSLSVTYKSSNENVAKIDANGNIVLGSEGKTTITAIGAESATHKSATDTYELIVVASNCRWVEVTDNTTLEDGDEVVISMTLSTGTSYVLPNAEATNAVPDAIKITNTTSFANDYIWIVDKDGNNLKFESFIERNKFLTCSNADDGVRINTGANKTFVVDDTYGYLKNTQTTKPRYLGVHIDKIEWYSYALTNTGLFPQKIAGQTLKFYKRECLDASKVWVEGNLTNVTCTPQLPQQLAKDGSITLTFTAADGYALPNDVTVTNATKTWNKTTGTLTISNPTGNVLVTVEAVELHTITWMVGNNPVLTEEVANATGVTKTPTDDPTDDAIGDCANAFMGWSEKSAGSTPQDVAYYDDLCTAAQMKAKHTSVTGDKTFYAVFATAITTPGTSITEEETYSHTITSQIWDATGAKMLNNVSWTLANNGGYYGYDGTKGQQVGSGSKPAKSMTLTTSGFASASKITSVTINTSGASDTNAKVSVKVGGTSYSCNANTTPAISTTATDYKFTGNSTGEIVISWSQTSSKAIYFKSITVVYSNTTTTPDVTTYSNYVTNCCALAPATNLTVSGTTSNTATLTWTAPSPATGITKLQVRNAADDEVVVDNIAVGTTTATITGLAECTKYNYYVVSVGDCEVFSNTVTAQPFSNAKTVNYDYNGGSGSPASFTTSCTNQTITLPTATRAGYDFNGWYTAATGGTKVGDAGDTYNPTTSSITLYAQWTKKIYIISFHANGGEGTMANQSADENDVVAQLNANHFTRDGYAFVGWNTKANGTGIAYADQATDITLTGNLTLYAQWAAIVTLNDAGNVTTTHPETAGGSITLEDGANACDPYEFVGWTTVATGDWNEGINEPTLVPSPYSPTEPTTLYAVYKIQSEGNANAFKLSFEGGNGKTYYVGEYGSSPYLRGYSNITEADAVTFIRKKMFPNDDTKYYLYLEHLEEYLYCSSGNLYTTSNEPSESQGWVFHTVGDKIQIQVINQERYLSYSDRDDDRINITTHSTGSQESFNMLSAVTSTYVASPLCNQEIEIIFETGNGNFVDNAPATNPLTVSRGDVITLPTCEYPGYEFMGWLKDEQQEVPSDIIGTYYTGDYTVDGVSSTITFYAYYKAIPEEVEFTGKDDVELLMYYYDGTENYYYAVSHAAERGELSSKQNCFNATTWTFTNVGNMQYYIQDETGKYLGAVNDNDNDLSLSNTPKVWNFTLVNGLWKMVCEDSPSRALMNRSGNSFVNAALTNISNSAYSYVALGICPSPTYTTNPVLSQGFSITNTAMVTSASGQKVKAASVLTLETRNIELPCTFTIAAPNITFYDNTGAEVTELESSAASEQFELHFAYKPTAENTIEYPTVTITDDEHKTYTIKNRIYARSLPATFAIVAKVGEMWYALPSQGLNSSDVLTGYPIEVDDQADPTIVKRVPENADWSLRQVYAGQNVNATKDRFKQFGANMVFVNNENTSLLLSASRTENYLLTDANYTSYQQADNQGLYEWTPATTDLETYTLTNANPESGRDIKLSMNITNIFGVHKQNVATTELRFLPIENRYTQASLQVVEWRENSIVVMYTGNPAQTATLTINGTEQIGTTSLNASGVQKDLAIYELPASGIASKATQRLCITIGTSKKWLTIPYIINNSITDVAILNNTNTTKAVAAVTDVVVLNEATFIAAGTKDNKYTFRNITVYGGGKLFVPASAADGFGIYSLVMRLGTVKDGTYTNSYPQLVMNGKYSNTSGIYLDYITTYERYYALSVPYTVKTKDIKYPAEIYGDNLKTGNKASFAFQYYDGETRATGATGWKDFDETVAEPKLTPYQGYTFWGAPRKVSINGAEPERPKFGIHRIPLTGVGADVLLKAETSGKTIDIIAYPAERPNDMGWNFLGNPYLAQYGGLSADNELVQVGLLEQEMIDGKWTGGWKHTGNLRYITTTTDGQTYTPVEVDKATFSPFNTFFIQAATKGALSFVSASRAQSLPARHYAAQQEAAKEITTGIILTGNNQTDRTGLLIADNFTEEYDFNADLSKFENSGINLYTIGKDGKLAYMAINQALAEQPIPVGYSVPVEGLYTVAFDEDHYNATDISALYLIDYDSNEKTNLLHTDYSFVTAAGTNNQRFALQVAFAPENATNVEWVGDATIQVGVEGHELILNNLPTDAAVHVFDALGRLMYHTPHAPTEMQLTLPTGYYLVRIADKQNAVVTNIVIP